MFILFYEILMKEFVKARIGSEYDVKLEDTFFFVENVLLS